MLKVSYSFFTAGLSQAHHTLCQQLELVNVGGPHRCLEREWESTSNSSTK